MYHANTAQGRFSHQTRTGGFSKLNVFALAALMLDVSRERRQLRALDTASLKDLGLDPADAAREGARPMWDLPLCRKNRC